MSKRLQKNSNKQQDSGNKSKVTETVEQTTAIPEDTRKISLSVAGYPQKHVPYPVILAKKSKEVWSASLKKFGVEGLLLKIFGVLEDSPTEDYYAGMRTSYWIVNTESPPAPFSTRQFALPANNPSGMYTHNSNFPRETALTAILATIGLAIQSSDSCSLSASVPHLLVSSDFGFTSKYFKDSSPILYRCFLFMGRESLKDEDVLPEQYEQENAQLFHSFVATGDAESVKTFGNNQVLTMTALFQEAHRKFRMQVGDILVVKGGYPFAVDFATNYQKGSSRMLLWSYVKKEQHSSGLVSLPSPKPIDIIEDIIHKNTEALQFYTTEMEEVESSPKDAKDKVDTLGYMERLRVTPEFYSAQDILTRIGGERGFYDIFEWIHRQ